MAAVAGAAGEIDDLDGGVIDQNLSHRLGQGVDGQGDQVGIKAEVGQHPTALARHDGHGQDGDGVRFQNDRIAGRQTGEQGRIGVPGREAGAADHQSDPAWDQNIGLVQTDGLAGEVAFVAGVAGHVAHGLGGIGQGLDTPVQGVGAGAAEGLGIALTRDVHDGLRHFEVHVIETGRHLGAQGQTQFGIGGAPVGPSDLGGGDQGLGITARIGDPQRLAGEGRDLGADMVDDAGQVQIKGVVQLGLERGLAGDGLVRPVDLGRGRILERRPGGAGGHGLDRGVDQGGMAFDQGEPGVGDGEGRVHGQRTRSTIMAEPTPCAPAATTRP
ncbi:hypothetical protein D3C80_910290 [compost metagenome]